VIYALVLLFFVLALSFLGVFEISDWITQRLGKFQNSGSFWTGVLAVFVATPCTGPFMGAVLGAAAFMPPAQSLLLFLSLGLGLALPFLALGFIPALARKIPKPGPWMLRLKEFFAFPLFATAIWLIWVLSLQTGSTAVVITLSTCLCIGFCLWVFSNSKKTGVWLAVLGLILSSLLGGISLQRMQSAGLLLGESGPANHTSSSTWAQFDPQKLNELRAAGTAVFIDFTAAWCITCQVNKKVVLDTTAAQELFSRNQVVLMRADWTKQDPVIGSTLAQYGRNSLPLYLYFPPGSGPMGHPKILPQILTYDILRSAIEAN
jgi:thiol:disulfide interchange protein DsbD